MRILACHVGDIIMKMRWRHNWGSWFMDDVHLTKLNWSHQKWGFVISKNHSFSLGAFSNVRAPNQRVSGVCAKVII
jgi:hypothetical protein